MNTLTTSKPRWTPAGGNKTGRALCCSLLILSVLFILTGGHGSAASAEEYADSGWKSSLGLGLNLTKGNSEATLFTAHVESQRIGAVYEVRLKAEGNYGTSKVERSDGTDDTEVNVQNVRGTADLRRLVSDRAYSYMNLEALQDEIADVDYRIVLGGGMGYYWIKSKKTSLSSEAGPSYVAQEINRNRDGYFAMRVAEDFEYQFTDRSRIWQSAEYVLGLRDTGKYLVTAELGGEAALNAQLALRVVLQDKYDNRPGPGKEENDLALTSGITYRF